MKYSLNWGFHIVFKKLLINLKELYTVFIGKLLVGIYSATVLYVI